jgi:hypothetical protein
MKLIRLLCQWFPAQRAIIIGFGYLGLVILASVWLVCFVVPAVSFLFFDSSHFLLAANGMPPLSPRQTMLFCWLISLFGFVCLYLAVKELRELRLENKNRP